MQMDPTKTYLGWIADYRNENFAVTVQDGVVTAKLDPQGGFQLSFIGRDFAVFRLGNTTEIAAARIGSIIVTRD